MNNTQLKNIAVLVSGGGTNLQAIIDSINSGIITHGKIAVVISSKDGVYALERASNAGIKTEVVSRKEIPDRKEYTLKIMEVLKSYKVDLVVLAGFMCILDGCILDEYKNKIINVHPALIPSFCGDGFYGLHVHEAALAKGVKVTGATVHFVNEITDGGAIILQKAVPVEDDDTPETLQKRVMVEAEWKILPEAIELFCSDMLKVKDNRVYICK